MLAIQICRHHKAIELGGCWLRPESTVSTCTGMTKLSTEASPESEYPVVSDRLMLTKDFPPLNAPEEQLEHRRTNQSMCGRSSATTYTFVLARHLCTL
ncbi:hypothetical protein TKK_0011648 [Trichogramma kaykai]